MAHPLEYGDNFPVLAGSWDCRVPWRFPKQAVRQKSPWRGFSWLFPWIMLGLGITLGLLFAVRFHGEGSTPADVGLSLPAARTPSPPPGQGMPKNRVPSRIRTGMA